MRIESTEIEGIDTSVWALVFSGFEAAEKDEGDMVIFCIGVHHE